MRKKSSGEAGAREEESTVGSVLDVADTHQLYFYSETVRVAQSARSSHSLCGDLF